MHDCELCEYTTYKWGNLTKHMQNRHNVGVVWKDCPDCEKRFKQTTQLNAHVNAVHNINATLHTCDQCKFSTKHASSLRRHKINKHTTRTAQYPCSKCDLKFKDKSSLGNHIHRMHTANIKMWDCEQCDKQFKSNSELTQHIYCMHTPDKILIDCKHCERKCKTNSDMHAHLMRAHNINVKWKRCPHCDVICITNAEITHHMKYKHNIGIVWNNCTECNAKFKTKSDCTRHKGRIHDIGNKECNLCLDEVYKLVSYNKLNICKKCYYKLTGQNSRIESQMSYHVDEHFGKDFLVASNTQIYGNKCQRYRPDKLYAFDNLVIQIECDENQHKYNNGDYSCDERRISNIYDEFPGKDYIVIRWNPHKYRTRTTDSEMLDIDDRLKILVDCMKMAQTMIVPNKILIIYLFYDNDNPRISKNIQKIFISTPKQLRLEKIVNLTLYKHLSHTPIISHEFTDTIAKICGKNMDGQLHLKFPYNKAINFNRIMFVLHKYMEFLGTPHKDSDYVTKSIELQRKVISELS